MAASSSTSADRTPRACDGISSLREIAVPMAIGPPTTRAMAEETTVPKPNGRAPNRSLTGSQAWLTMKPGPNWRKAGTACTSIVRASAATIRRIASALASTTTESAAFAVPPVGAWSRSRRRDSMRACSWVGAAAVCIARRMFSFQDKRKLNRTLTLEGGQPREGRARALAGRRGPAPPAVRLDQVLDDREPEAGPAGRARAIGLVEALEETRRLARRDADAGVGDKDRDVPAPPF